MERYGKNYKIFEYLENEKSFLDEVKNIFHKELAFGEKIQISSKIADKNFKHNIYECDFKIVS